MASSPPDGAVTLHEPCTAAMARRVAAMLDLDPAGLRDGVPLPRGWHFPLLGAQTARRELREDGFPGLGVPMPDLGLPRLLLAGRDVTYHDDLPIGAMIKRVSAVRNLTRKDDERGVRAVVTIGHTLSVAGHDGPAVTETQTYMLLPAGGRFSEGNRIARTVAADRTTIFIPDATLLFQYSALGFNSHRIHIDRDFATGVEGFPDLVVNGGLTTLLLTEFARAGLGMTIRSLRMKNTAPLFAGRPMTLAATLGTEETRLRAYDDMGTLGADAEVEIACPSCH
ncbi:MAG: hypothetical protein EOP66_00285 [Sphingomonas sp.]|nr:MAG: hypothetical protein EOP66_00285 [Sphingomonas sp.]